MNSLVSQAGRMHALFKLMVNQPATCWLIDHEFVLANNPIKNNECDLLD